MTVTLLMDDEKTKKAYEERDNEVLSASQGRGTSRASVC